MTYILNAICVGLRVPLPFRSGSIVAELDEPHIGDVDSADEFTNGIHYLVVVDDGSGYTGSDEFVLVPEDPDLPAVLRLPPIYRDDVRKLLSSLVMSSPHSRVVVYLESNRAITRSDPDEPHPIAISRLAFASLEDFWQAELAGKIAEDCVVTISEAYK